MLTETVPRSGPASRGRRHAAVAALIGAASVLVVADAVVGAFSGAPAMYVVLWSAAMAGMVVAGVLVLRDPAHAGLGGLLLGVAATGSLWDLVGALPDAGPLPFAVGFLYWPYAGLLAHLLVRWPDRAIPGRTARALVLVVYAVMPLVTALWELTWDPRWYDVDTSSWWWPTPVPARDLAADVYLAQELAVGAVVLALVAIVLARTAEAHGARRIALAPVAVVGLGLAAAVLLEVLGDAGVPVPVDVVLVQDVAVLAVPVGVLVAARLDHGDESSLVPGAAPGSFEEFRDRYRFRIAAVAAAVVTVAIVLFAASSGVGPGDAADPAPAPGPALLPG